MLFPMKSIPQLAQSKSTVPFSSLISVVTFHCHSDRMGLKRYITEHCVVILLLTCLTPWIWMLWTWVPQSQGLCFIHLCIPRDCQECWHRNCSVNVRVGEWSKETPLSISFKVGKKGCQLPNVGVWMKWDDTYSLCRIITAQIPPCAHYLPQVGLQSMVICFLPTGPLHGGDFPIRVSSLPSQSPWEVCSPMTWSPTGHLSLSPPSLQRLALFHPRHLS